MPNFKDEVMKDLILDLIMIIASIFIIISLFIIKKDLIIFSYLISNKFLMSISIFQLIWFVISFILNFRKLDSVS